MRLRGQGADHAGQFGLAVDLDEVQPGPRREGLAQHRKRHRRGPVEQVLQLAQCGDGLLAGGEQRGHHRRHQERVGGPGGERRQQRRRVGLAGERARRPRVDAEQRIAGAADVEQRHRDQVAVTRAQRRQRDRVLSVLDDVAVRQHHALRPPGRAGAVHHQPQVLRGHVAAAVGGAGGGQERLVAVVRAAHRDHVGDAGQPVPDGIDRGQQLGPGEQHAGPRVVDHVVELAGRQPPVDHGAGRAEQSRAQRHFQAGRVVLVQERHPVAAPEAERGQAAGHPPDPVVPLCPRPPHPAVGQRLGVRPYRGPVRDRVGHEVHSWRRHYGHDSPSRLPAGATHCQSGRSGASWQPSPRPPLQRRASRVSARPGTVAGDRVHGAP